MSWSEELDGWTSWLRAAGRPDTTIGLRRYHLQRVARELSDDPWTLTVDQLVEWLGAPTGHHRPAARTGPAFAPSTHGHKPPAGDQTPQPTCFHQYPSPGVDPGRHPLRHTKPAWHGLTSGDGLFCNLPPHAAYDGVSSRESTAGTSSETFSVTACG